MSSWNVYRRYAYALPIFGTSLGVGSYVAILAVASGVIERSYKIEINMMGAQQCWEMHLVSVGMPGAESPPFEYLSRVRVCCCLKLPSATHVKVQWVSTLVLHLRAASMS